MTSPSPSSPNAAESTNSLTPQELARRILAGENVPTDTLTRFIEEAESLLRGERRQKAPPPTDVDFF